MNRISITAHGSGDHLATLAKITALLNENGYAVENFTANNYTVGSSVNLPMAGLLPPGEAEQVVAESAAALAPTESVTDKKKRLAAEKRAIKKAEKDAQAAEAAALTEDEPAPVVILDDLKLEVKNAIERSSIDDVKSVFTAHGATKISELDEADYGAVFEQLAALVAF